MTKKRRVLFVNRTLGLINDLSILLIKKGAKMKNNDEKLPNHVLMTGIIVFFMLIYSTYMVMFIDKIIIENAMTEIEQAERFEKMLRGYIYTCNEK